MADVRTLRQAEQNPRKIFATYEIRECRHLESIAGLLVCKNANIFL